MTSTLLTLIIPLRLFSEVSGDEFGWEVAKGEKQQVSTYAPTLPESYGIPHNGVYLNFSKQGHTHNCVASHGTAPIHWLENWL